MRAKRPARRRTNGHVARQQNGTTHTLEFVSDYGDRVAYLVFVRGSAVDVDAASSVDQWVQPVPGNDNLVAISGFVVGGSDTYEITGDVVRITVGQGNPTVTWDGQDITSNPQQIVSGSAGGGMSRKKLLGGAALAYGAFEFFF